MLEEESEKTGDCLENICITRVKDDGALDYGGNRRVQRCVNGPSI